MEREFPLHLQVSTKMKVHITKGDIRGVESEMKRTIKQDREYIVEWRETSRSESRRKKYSKKKMVNL